MRQHGIVVAGEGAAQASVDAWCALLVEVGIVPHKTHKRGSLARIALEVKPILIVLPGGQVPLMLASLNGEDRMLLRDSSKVCLIGSCAGSVCLAKGKRSLAVVPVRCVDDHRLEAQELAFNAHLVGATPQPNPPTMTLPHMNGPVLAPARRWLRLWDVLGPVRGVVQLRPQREAPLLVPYFLKPQIVSKYWKEFQSREREKPVR